METHYNKIQSEFDVFYKEFLTMSFTDLQSKYPIIGGIDGSFDIYVGDYFEHLQEAIIMLQEDGTMFVNMSNVTAKDENGVNRLYSVSTPRDSYAK